VRTGRAAFRRIRDVYDEVTVTPERIEAVGEDDVLVIARLRGRASGSGVEIDTLQGYVWTVREGVAVRFRWFSDPQQARDAAG
jgi:ketosteroid isomerase-like protein